MPIASKLLYFQRRPSPAPPDPGPEPPDPRRRAGRDHSARQRRRSSFSSHHKPVSPQEATCRFVSSSFLPFVS